MVMQPGSRAEASRCNQGAAAKADGIGEQHLKQMQLRNSWVWPRKTH